MNYKILSISGNDMVEITFPGYFQGINVDWNATIITLKRHYKDTFSPEYPVRTKKLIRQFIEIPGDIEFSPYEITIGLNLDEIDEPTILKTIIMINNYKNLAIGKHVFGDTVALQI